jgi:hypothetical protein
MQVSGLEIVVGRSLTREADGCTDNGISAQYGYRCEPELFFVKRLSLGYFRHFHFSSYPLGHIVNRSHIPNPHEYCVCSTITSRQNSFVASGIATPFKLGGVDTAAR